MVIPTPCTLVSQTDPFDDPDWVFEIKHDGFRALAVIEDGRCRFFSRNRHRLTGFRDLGEAIVNELHVDNAILDGELAATDELGRTVFTALMRPAQRIRYFAFDLLWLDGDDLRASPLVARKDKLRRLVPARSQHVLYVDHTRGAGKELYELAYLLKLEGIVAKRADSPYEEHGSPTRWITIDNPSYVHKQRRQEMFNNGQKSDAGCGLP